MKLLCKFWLRTPEAIYRLYAWRAVACLMLHALVSVFVVSAPMGLLLFALTRNTVFALTSAPLFTMLCIHALRLIGGNRVPRKKKLLYGDATFDKELSDLALPISRKAGLAPIPVMRSVDVDEARVVSFEDDVSVILVRPDIWARHTTETLRGVIAHEVGHLCIPFGKFARREIGARFLWPIDFCSWCFKEISIYCYKHYDVGARKFLMLLPATMFHVLADLLWLLSFSRTKQLDEYAADCHGVLLLGDVLPLAKAYISAVKLGEHLGKEGERQLNTHPPLVSRINRLLDMHFLAYGAR